MAKKPVEPMTCEACPAVMPLHGPSSGWFTIIRATNPGTATVVLCPQCYSLRYNAPAEAKVSTQH